MTTPSFQQTLDNLNAAFQGESNAANRYKDFAKKADAEGHTYAARLFRAASRAETVHLEAHKKAILAMGGTVKAFSLDEVKIGTTAENLAVAVAGEVHERDVMYPQFLQVARAEGAKEAVRTMTYALKAETEHAKLFQDALDNLGHNADLPLFVCPVCGYTTSTLPEKKCPACPALASDFERIA